MKLKNLLFILIVSGSLYSEDVLNETVYWELTRVDTKIEENKFDEAEKILKYWYKKIGVQDLMTRLQLLEPIFLSLSTRKI